jgi:hypothetical protein
MISFRAKCHLREDDRRRIPAVIQLRGAVTPETHALPVRAVKETFTHADVGGAGRLLPEDVVIAPIASPIRFVGHDHSRG